MDRIIFLKCLQLSIILAEWQTDPTDRSFNPHEKNQDAGEAYRYKHILNTSSDGYDDKMQLDCKITSSL